MRAPHPSSSAAQATTRGFTLLETLVVVAIAGTMAAVALPSLLAGVEEFRVASAARYLAGRLQDARLQAVRRSAAVAVRFQSDVSGIRYASFVDGNHNGVRTPDIAAGVDRRLTDEERLGDQFAGVTFGIVDGVPLVGATSVDVADRSPLQVGRAGIVTFSPSGSATSGTLYVRGRGRSQYAVRILGVTGRTRVLRFDVSARRWPDP